MIVTVAKIRGKRIAWRLDPEPGDEPPSYPELWVEGLVRPLGTAVEALWLALAVGSLPRNRLLLPCPVPGELRRRLEAVLGIAIEAEAASEPPVGEFAGEFAATLVGDPLDAMLAAMLRDPGNFAIACTSDPLGPGAAVADIRLASNAGALRRHRQPLDRIGELATALLLAPGLSLSRVTGFLCSDELAGIGATAVSELAAAAGVELVLPLAEVKAHQLGDLAMALRLPPLAAIRAAWQRYRMLPEIMAAIYRPMHPALADAGIDDAIARICGYYVAQSSPEADANLRFDLSAFDAA